MGALFEKSPQKGHLGSFSVGGGTYDYEHMYDRLMVLVAELKKVVEVLDPEVLEPGFAVKLVGGFSEAERVCSAGKALAARRVESSGTWRKSGERSAAHWMSKATGEPLSNAISTLQTARQVADLPETERALRSGKLSAPQASQIASAGSVAPGFESDLLKAAEMDGFSGLKQRCEKVRASAVADEAARHEAIYRSRKLRFWTDGLGAFRLDASLTPEAGGTLLAALEPLRKKIFAEAREQGRKEPYEAYAADALVEMAKHVGRCESEAGGSGPRAMVQVKVDHSALLRGYIEGGETCEIVGVGPVPVATARELASDCFLTGIVTDGVDINSVSSPTRTIPARLRVALEDRDPVCVVPACNNRRFLEIDHITPVTEGGPTCLSNLARLCSYHHGLKTYRGYRLSGKAGAWIWEPPRPPG